MRLKIPRETAIINGVPHTRCGGKCGQMRPNGAFYVCKGKPHTLCKFCHAQYYKERWRLNHPIQQRRERTPAIGERTPKAEAKGSYLETLEEFQAWASKRGKPWKAEIVKVLNAWMERQAEKSHG